MKIYHIACVFSFWFLSVPVISGPYVVPKNITDKFPAAYRSWLLLELDYGCWSNYPNDPSAKDFYKAITTYAPHMHNPDDTDPSYVISITSLRRWIRAMENFNFHKLELMSPKVLKKYVKNAQQCADRIHNTPSFWCGGKKHLDEIMEITGLAKEDFTSFGVQNIHRDPLIFYGGIFVAALMPICAEIKGSYDHDQLVFRVENDRASIGMEQGLNSNGPQRYDFLKNIIKDSCGTALMVPLESNCTVTECGLAEQMGITNPQAAYFKALARKSLNGGDFCFAQGNKTIEYWRFDRCMDWYFLDCLRPAEMRIEFPPGSAEKVCDVFLSQTNDMADKSLEVLSYSPHCYMKNMMGKWPGSLKESVIALINRKPLKTAVLTGMPFIWLGCQFLAYLYISEL